MEEFFQPAETKEKYVKVLVYGAPKVGKTYTILDNFPAIALIDTERGADYYGDEFKERGKQFHTVNAVELDDILRIVRKLKRNKHTFKTLFIDSATITYEQLTSNTMKKYTAKTKALMWNEIKTEWKKLLRELVQLKMNVIVTAHEKNNYLSAEEGGDYLKVDPDRPFTPNLDVKNSEHMFDFTLRFYKEGGKRLCTVIGSRRENYFKNDDTIEIKPGIFKEVLGEVIEKEAAVEDIISPDRVAEIKKCFKALDFDEDTIKATLEKKYSVSAVEEITQEEGEALITKLNNKIKLKNAK